MTFFVFIWGNDSAFENAYSRREKGLKSVEFASFIGQKSRICHDFATFFRKNREFGRFLAQLRLFFWVQSF